MAPAYPKTDSEADRAAAARYHAMNNVFFLEGCKAMAARATLTSILVVIFAFHPFHRRNTTMSYKPLFVCTPNYVCEGKQNKGGNYARSAARFKHSSKSAF
jgi:hypothetical protein